MLSVNYYQTYPLKIQKKRRAGQKQEDVLANIHCLLNQLICPALNTKQELAPYTMLKAGTGC
jgi:hypothetical protein